MYTHCVQVYIYVYTCVVCVYVYMLCVREIRTLKIYLLTKFQACTLVLNYNKVSRAYSFWEMVRREGTALLSVPSCSTWRQTGCSLASSLSKVFALWSSTTHTRCCPDELMRNRHGCSWQRRRSSVVSATAWHYQGSWTAFPSLLRELRKTRQISGPMSWQCRVNPTHVSHRHVCQAHSQWLMHLIRKQTNKKPFFSPFHTCTPRFEPLPSVQWTWPQLRRSRVCSHSVNNYVNKITPLMHSLPWHALHITWRVELCNPQTWRWLPALSRISSVVWKRKSGSMEFWFFFKLLCRIVVKTSDDVISLWMVAVTDT